MFLPRRSVRNQYLIFYLKAFDDKEVKSLISARKDRDHAAATATYDGNLKANQLRESWFYRQSQHIYQFLLWFLTYINRITKPIFLKQNCKWITTYYKLITYYFFKNITINSLFQYVSQQKYCFLNDNNGLLHGVAKQCPPNMP